MSGERLLPVVTSIGVNPGRCKYCGQRIYWATLARMGHGRPARVMPWNSKPIPARTERNDETRTVIEYWPAGELHFKTCQEQPDRTQAKKRTEQLQKQSIAKFGSLF